LGGGTRGKVEKYDKQAQRQTGIQRYLYQPTYIKIYLTLVSKILPQSGTSFVPVLISLKISPQYLFLVVVIAPGTHWEFDPMKKKSFGDSRIPIL
jgi:hypothetical protein